jgi:hypothetical protein
MQRSGFRDGYLKRLPFIELGGTVHAVVGIVHVTPDD